MSAVMHPSRKYRFMVEAVVPPCYFDDDELRLYLAAQRALLLGGMVAAMQVLPFTAEQSKAIDIETLGNIQ